MRNQTLAGICVFFGIAVGVGMWSLGYSMPFGLSPFVSTLIVVPLLLLILTPLNHRLLKARGRNLEEEQRHELAESEMITLQRQEKSEADSYRIYDGRRGRG